MEIIKNCFYFLTCLGFFFFLVGGGGRDVEDKYNYY